MFDKGCRIWFTVYEPDYGDTFKTWVPDKTKIQDFILKVFESYCSEGFQEINHIKMSREHLPVSLKVFLSFL